MIKEGDRRAGLRRLPGTNDVRLPNALTPYTRTGITITDQNAQHFDVTVAVGHVTFAYQKTDGSQDKPDRCFVNSASGKSKDFQTVGPKASLDARAISRGRVDAEKTL